ncbi:MAG: hypothetical protein KME15_04920 [Drouetiella hepatica Uher 2000/2452]|jgi:hypothetical protein|uniref:Uncharacterized protein n=1 Tax=Drouetiella hepatica Uher 2000/2452 TaxID=904376 RepID=A0A951QAW7_9CYAN|nr:hypothetical protein [Drouetiella hepatica Uher 2000/2452]
MSRSQRFQVLILQNIRFWLPLLLLAFGFWIAGRFITLQVLNQSNNTSRALVANTQTDEATTPQIASITVEIDRSRGIALAQVKLFKSALKKLEFEFFLTEPQAIEASIAQELGRSPQEIKRLVIYKIIDR